MHPQTFLAPDTPSDIGGPNTYILDPFEEISLGELIYPPASHIPGIFEESGSYLASFLSRLSGRPGIAETFGNHFPKGIEGSLGLYRQPSPESGVKDSPTDISLHITNGRIRRAVSDIYGRERSEVICGALGILTEISNLIARIAIPVETNEAVTKVVKSLLWKSPSKRAITIKCLSATDNKLAINTAQLSGYILEHAMYSEVLSAAINQDLFYELASYFSTHPGDFGYDHLALTFICPWETEVVKEALGAAS